MRRFLSWSGGAVALLGLLVPPLQAQADEEPRPEKIFLLIGQSNMAGRAPLEKGDEEAIPGVYLLDPMGKWEKARNPLNRHASNRKTLSMQRIGPGAGFVATLRKADPKTSVGLIVNARGGTKIEEWEKGKPLYDNTLKRLAALPPGTKLAAVLWHQGEGNANDPKYLDKLATLIETLRADLKDPELPFIAGEVAKDLPVNKHIDALPERVKHSAYASAEELKVFDGVHFDRASQLKLGQRYAEAYLKLAGKSDPK